MIRTLVIHDPSGLGQGIITDAITGEIIKSNSVISPHNFLKEIRPINCKFEINIGGIFLYRLNNPNMEKVSKATLKPRTIPLKVNIPIQLIKYHGIIINYMPINETEDFDILCVYGQESTCDSYYIDSHKILIQEGIIGFADPI